jgi:methylenetetrahydrofolate reductase (NADPH)
MEVGVEISLEIIEKIRQISGVNGIHIMAVHWEEIIPRLVEEANLPRPRITEFA